MKICIYCGSDNQDNFKGREHVIPKLMGTFKNNPTIIGQVCDNCNSKIFNPLETKFKEDTEEGIYYQMFNFENSCQIRIRGENVKTSFSAGLGDSFFNEMFPFLKYQEGGWKVVFLPQIKIKRYGNGGYLILLIDGLKKIKNNEKKFLEIRNLVKDVRSKEVSIFAGGDSDVDDKRLKEAISLVKELGIDYVEATRKSAPIDAKKQFEISMDCRVGNEVSRVISKIAFNYFSFCAIKDKQENILFHKNFSKIKDYILGLIDLPIKKVITAVGNKPIIFDEKIKNMKLVGHAVAFLEDHGNIMSQVSFLGKRIYSVALGEIPEELMRVNFGCGHIFDPIHKNILGLTQNPKKWGSGQEMGFGLFNRI